jgi:hypothetical protein
MIKFIGFIILFNLMFQFASGQNRNSFWIFGDSCGIDFSNISNPVPITSNMDGRGSCASIADTSGNLICYASVLGYLNSDWATRIFNAQHQILQGANHITGEGWYNEVVIIPKPNDTSKYYVFSVGLDKPNNQGCFYTLIDMSLNNGSGAVLQQNINVNNATSGDCLTAVQHGNGRDWWVINKYSSKTAPNQFNRFFVYLVSPDTVMPPFTYDFNDATDADFQKIIWNSSGSRFMLINVGGYMAEFNFDRCTGSINLFNSIYPEQPNNWNRLFWEGAYSPNDSVFYIATSGVYKTDTLYLLQFNLFSTNIPASCDTLDVLLYPIGTGAVRLAPDGKIYCTRAYDNPFVFSYPYPDSMRNYVNENLSVINNPNALGAACNYTPFSFYLGGKRTYYGLPNNPNYELGPLVGSPCDTLGLNTPKPPTGGLNTGILQCTYISSWQKLFVNASGVKGRDVTVSIYDATGKQVYSKGKSPVEDLGVHSGYVTLDVDCTGWSDGLYVVYLETEKELLSKKFVKE